MLTEQEENDNTTPSNSLFSIGENVKVTEGAFSSFRGKITSVDSDKGRVKVEVMIFSRPTEVELSYLEVERS
jgi:transcriptional antiterminator NusG